MANVRHFKTLLGWLLIQFNIRCYGTCFPSLFSNLAIKLLLKFQKVSPSVPDCRWPITLSILHRMQTVLRDGVFSSYIDALLDSVFLLAFYAFLWCGEFTTTLKSFSLDRDISFSDLAFHPSLYSLRLKHSKCGGDCSVAVTCTDSIYDQMPTI